ncbi:HNH endonuclease [Streptomyces xanthophaeus]|uniref:HNH endonuclease n=1 Tax=Streptomyces xanthophaeus TaxID=67385 RepID=UPI003681C7AB
MAKPSLTDDQARQALAMVRSGKTQTAVAAHFGATLSRINQLVNGKTYKHLHGTAGSRISDGGQRYNIAETPERRRHREARFWERVDRSAGPNGCWPFKGVKGNKYGNTAAGQNMTGSASAHVVAFTLAHGLPQALPSTTLLRHLCDFKPCCNPGHLLPGTKSENNQDTWAARKEGRTGAKTVTDPVGPPPDGWKIQTGDVEELDRAARESEFWARVDRSGGEEACWPWTAKTRNHFGYGQLRWEGTQAALTHRISYALTHGMTYQELGGVVLSHVCPEAAHRNNCNNPRHLRAGTQAENIADKTLHGTNVMGERHHMGQRYPDAIIREARIRFHTAAPGQRPTITSLAEEAGTSVTVMSRWLRGESREAAGGPIGIPHADVPLVTVPLQLSLDEVS